MSSKNLWQTRLPPALHHKVDFAYEWVCGSMVDARWGAPRPRSSDQRRARRPRAGRPHAEDNGQAQQGALCRPGMVREPSYLSYRLCLCRCAPWTIRWGAVRERCGQTAGSTIRRSCCVPPHQPICCIRVRMRALAASIRWGVRVRGAGSTAARRAARSRVRAAADVW